MRNLQEKANGTGTSTPAANFFNAEEFNSIAHELENACTTAGLVLQPAAGPDGAGTQLAQAMSRYGSGGAKWMEDSGASAPNAYVVNSPSPFVGTTVPFVGQEISFAVGANINTGIACNINVNGSGNKRIYGNGTSDPTAGMLRGYVVLRYSGTYWNIANAANTTALNYLNYEGTIIQWGSCGSVVSKSWATVTLPVAYPTSLKLVLLQHKDFTATASPANESIWTTEEPVGGPPFTGFTMYNNTNAAAIFNYLSIGY